MVCSRKEAPEAVRRVEGIGRDPRSDRGFAWQCLVARRPAERGVRFIELIDAGSDTDKNGMDHTRLTYRYAGRDFRLTDLHENVVKALLTG